MLWAKAEGNREHPGNLAKGLTILGYAALAFVQGSTGCVRKIFQLILGNEFFESSAQKTSETHLTYSFSFFILYFS